MPSVERKSIDRIHPGDRLMEDIGVFAKAGRPVDDKTIQLLAKHRVPFIYTVSPTYEEKKNFADEGAEKAFFEKWAQEKVTDWEVLRNELFEMVQDLFVPFSENDKAFDTRGKKLLEKGQLLTGRWDSFAQAEVDAGSLKLLPPHRIQALLRQLGLIYEHLNGFTYRGPDTLGKKNLIPRLSLHSIRLQPVYMGGRLEKAGTALAWHGVDTAFSFMAAFLNVNKKRNLLGLPFSQQRFDIDGSFSAETVFRYKDDYIIEASLGALLHPWGYCYAPLMELQSSRPVLDPRLPKDKSKIELLQKNISVIKALLRNRGDISAVARMVISGQHEHPDGTGYPLEGEKKIPHEFVRMFQICDHYDSLTNPYLHRTPFSRMGVMDSLMGNSGQFLPQGNHFPTPFRFDTELLEDFFWTQGPFAPGEKVYLFPRDNLSTPHFVGRVYQYYHSPLPYLSILRDERSDKNYDFGKLLFDLTRGEALALEGGRVVKRTPIPWIKKLIIHDVSISPGNMEQFQDVLWGGRRFKDESLYEYYG